jgi:hypothetical protein
VNLAAGFVERADADTVGTIGAVFGPESKTAFGIYVPFEGSGLVGDIVAFGGHLTIGYRPAGAKGRTFFTNPAKFFDTKWLIGVVTEG